MLLQEKNAQNILKQLQVFPNILIHQSWLVTGTASSFYTVIFQEAFFCQTLNTSMGKFQVEVEFKKCGKSRRKLFRASFTKKWVMTVISLLPISMNIMSSESVIKPKAFFKYSRRKCMVDISDWYINTFAPRRIHYVLVKQNWQLLERGQLSYLIVIMTRHNSCLSLGEQEKEELQKPFLFLGSESGKHLSICLSYSCSV